MKKPQDQCDWVEWYWFIFAFKEVLGHSRLPRRTLGWLWLPLKSFKLNNFSTTVYFEDLDLAQNQLPDRYPQQTRLGFGFTLTDLLVQKLSTKTGNFMWLNQWWWWSNAIKNSLSGGAKLTFTLLEQRFFFFLFLHRDWGGGCSALADVCHLRLPTDVSVYHSPGPHLTADINTEIKHYKRCAFNSKDGEI